MPLGFRGNFTPLGLNVALRVGILFIMDYVLLSKYAFSFNLTQWISAIFMWIYNFNFGHFTYSKLQQISWFIFDANFVVEIFYCFIHYAGLLTSCVFLFYPLRALRVLSVFILYGLFIYASFMMNSQYIDFYMSLNQEGSTIFQELSSSGAITAVTFFGNYFYQIISGTLIYVLFCNVPNPQRFVLGLFFIFPTVLTFMNIPKYVIYSVPLFCAIVQTLIIAFYILWSSRQIIFLQLFQPLYEARFFVFRDGLFQALMLFLGTVDLWNTFLCFFLMRSSIKIVDYLYSVVLSNNIIVISTTASVQTAFKYLMCENSNTILSIVGMACTFVTIAVFLIIVIRKLLSLPQKVEIRTLRINMFFLFVSLSIACGLSGLESEDRFQKVTRGFFVIMAYVFQNILYDVDIALVQLNTIGYSSLSKYVKVFLADLLLAGCSILIVIFVVTTYDLNAWAMGILAFYIENLINITISIIVYFLCKIDNSFGLHGRLSSYSDNIVLLIKVNDFIFNVLQFCIGFLLLLFDNFGIIKLCILCTHLYGNIYLQFKLGWVSYFRKQYVSKFVKTLPQATDEQLQMLNDSCSICFEYLVFARITPCNHYFHEKCLIDCLYYGNTCPLCNRILLNREARNGVVHEHD